MGWEPPKAYEKAFALDEVDQFRFFLARALSMTVAELDARMSQDEYAQWQAFYRWERWKVKQMADHERVLHG